MNHLTRSKMRILLATIGMSALMAVACDPRAGYAAGLNQSAAVCDTVSEIPQSECQALAALFEQTAGDQWRNNSDWLVTSTPCTWYGVACTAGRVTALTLAGNQLAGEIPAQIGDLTALRTLHLQNNRLGGAIPDALGNLTALEELKLFNNQLSGPIPSALGDLAALQQLWLAVNQLSGPIPAALGNLTKLVALRMEYNALAGAIPESFIGLVDLHTTPYHGLDLGYNQLSATEPALVAFLQQKDPQLVPDPDCRPDRYRGRGPIDWQHRTDLDARCVSG